MNDDLKNGVSVIALTGHQDGDDTGILFYDDQNCFTTTKTVWIGWDSGSSGEFSADEIDRTIFLVPHVGNMEGRILVLRERQAEDERYRQGERYEIWTADNDGRLLRPVRIMDKMPLPNDVINATGNYGGYIRNVRADGSDEWDYGFGFFPTPQEAKDADQLYSQ